MWLNGESNSCAARAPFTFDESYQWLLADDSSGAVVTFTGKVRSNSIETPIIALTLEHYPQMTEKVLFTIAQEAGQRWPVRRVVIIHRFGKLLLGENIVLVGVSSEHRSSAFTAVEYIMDHLKTRAPFWKREITSNGVHWVKAKQQDILQTQRWDKEKK